MRNNIVKQLFLTNLLYVNPPQTKKYRQKYKGRDIRPKVFKNFLLLVIFNIFVILMLFGNPVAGSMFSGSSYISTLAFIVLFTLLSVSTAFLNMFYESNDTLELITLPITNKELFLSKFYVLLFQVAGIIIPFTVINFVTGLSSGFSLLKIVQILIYTIAMTCIIVGTTMIISSFMTYVPNFKKNKGRINGFLITLSIIGFLILVPFSTFTQTIAGEVVTENIFLRILKNPIDEIYLSLIILCILALVVFFLVNKLIIKNYFSTIYRINGTRLANVSNKNNKAKKISTKKTSLTVKFIKRNLKLFSNGTLIANVFSNALLGIMILAGGAFQARRSGGVQLEFEYYPAVIIFGITMSYIMLSNPINLTGVAISLEKHDYYHLLSLPLDFKKYLKIKLATGAILQVGISVILLVGLLIFAKLSPYLIFVAFVSFILSSTAVSFNNFVKDYKKLYLNWNNLIELSSRGVNQVLFAIIMIAIILGLIIIITGTIFIIMAFPSASHILGAIYLIGLFAFVIFNTLRLKKQVFDKIL